MGQPAARQGDSTAHGGVIMAGAPMVLIGGMPAARLGDMHVCPMVNPGTPPPPHVGMAIVKGSPMVLIGGQPAARVGDMCTCSGPPDSIIVGCFTVLIGEGGGGGGGAAGGGGKAAAGQAAAAKPKEKHFLDVKFVDKGGKPIYGVEYSIKGPNGRVEKGTLTGRIYQGGVEQGNYEITLKAIINAKWSTTSAEVGDKIKLTADTSNIDNGEKGTFEIFIKDTNFADRSLATLESKVDNDKIEATWVFEVDKSYLEVCDDKTKQKKYSSPSFYFMVKAGNLMARSNLLKLKDFLEIKLQDKDGKPIGNVGYRVHLPNGEIRKGKLDANGYAKEKNIPPGRPKVAFDIK